MVHIRQTADLDPQEEGAGNDREALLERRVLLEHGANRTVMAHIRQSWHI